MKITVAGVKKEVADGLTVAQLVKSLTLQAKKSSQAEEFPIVPSVTEHSSRARLSLSSAAEIPHYRTLCTFPKQLKRCISYTAGMSSEPMLHL